MKAQDLIRRKRDGASLSRAEINSFVRGVTNGAWADYQISAFLMACFTRGLNADESAFLTEEMLRSGEILDFTDFDRPKADKHSTGGVGDKTSLIVAPLAAACGLAIPMISGRGLGHTGGTLDKLESIAGYNVNLSLAEFKKIVKTCGFAMTGQTAEIAPADKKLYALRDATATVDCIPLIVASIMSKKMAEGLDALVLDVKTGNGAFMPKFHDALNLAKALCEVGNKCNVKTTAVISDMNEPLGKFVGNALEVYEAIKILRNDADEQMNQTRELSIELTARMLVSTDLSKDLESAKKLCETKLGDGSALEKFKENIKLQGSNAKICDAPETLLDKNILKIPIIAGQSGFVSEIDVKAIGQTVGDLGGGRMKTDDRINYQVGYQCEAKINDDVRAGDTFGVLFCRNQRQANAVKNRLQTAYKLNEENSAPLDLIKEIVL